MTNESTQVYDAAMALSDSERAEFAYRVLQSLALPGATF